MKYVYMVQFDWSTVDSDDIETDLFSNYDDAHRLFKEIVTDELNPQISKLGNIFDNSGNVDDRFYDFDQSGDPSKETNLLWHVVDKENYYCHSFVDLIKKELNERR